MPWATLWSPALGHLRASTSRTNSCLGLSLGRATLGQLLYDMSCVLSMTIIVKKITYTIYVSKIQISG